MGEFTDFMTDTQPQTDEKKTNVSEFSTFLNGGVDPAKQLQFSVDKGLERNPDSAARILNMQMKTGLPEDLIERNLDHLEREATKSQFNAEKFRETSDVVANWYAENPNHPAVAFRDAEKLSYIERLWKHTVNQKERGELKREMVDLGTKSWMEKITPQERRRLDEIKGVLAKEENFGIEGFWETFPGDIADQYPNYRDIFSSGLLTGGAGAVGGAATGATLAVATGGAASVAIPSFAIKGGVGGFVLGGAVETARTEGAHAFVDFESTKDENGNLMDRNVAKGAALAVGAINGSLEFISFGGIVSKIPGVKKVTQAFSKNAVQQALTSPTTGRAIRRLFQSVGESVASEGVTEFLQEMIPSVTSDLITMQQDGRLDSYSIPQIYNEVFSPEKLSQWRQAGVKGAKVGGGITTVTGSAQLAIDLKEVKKANAGKQVLENYLNGAASTELIGKAPAKLEEVIHRTVEGTPNENLNVSTEQWNTYFQSKNLDPGTVYNEVVGERDSYDSAIKENSDLRIPTAKYAAKLAATPHGIALVDHIRFEENEMTAFEAQEFVSKLKKEAEAVEKVDELNNQGQVIEDNLSDQLGRAGFDSGASKKYAQLHRSFFETMGKKFNLDPVELFNRYNLNIQREGISDKETLQKQPFVLKRGEETQTEIAIPETLRVSQLDVTKTELSKETQVVKNEHTQEFIRVSPQSVNKSITFSKKNKEASAVIGANIAKLMEGAVYASNAKTKAGDVYFLFAPIKTIKGDMLAKIKVKRLKELDFEGLEYLSHEVIATKEIPANEFSQASLTSIQKNIQDTVEREEYFQSLPEKRRELTPLGFYSFLKESVEKMDFKQVPVTDLINRITKIPGVKKEELEWTGLLDFLKLKLEENKDVKIKKEDVLDYLGNHGVVVDQLTLVEDYQGQGVEGEVLSWEEQNVSASEVDYDGSIAYDNASEDIDEQIRSGEIDDGFQAIIDRIRKEKTESLEEGDVLDEAAIMEEATEEYRDIRIDQINEDIGGGESVYSETDYKVTVLIDGAEETFVMRGRNEFGSFWGHKGSRDIHLFDFEGDENEAKIQFINFLKSREIIPNTTPLGEEFTSVDLVKWRDPESTTYFKDAELKEYLKANKEKIKAQILREATESGFEYDKENLKNAIENQARTALRDQRSNPDLSDNEVMVELFHPNIPLPTRLIGNNSVGWKISTKRDNKWAVGSGVTFKVEGENLDSAKARLIQRYVDEGSFTVPSSQQKAQPQGDPSAPFGNILYEDYAMNGGTNYREILLTLPTHEEFKSDPHFAPKNHKLKNVLAFARVSDRTTIDGKKVLLIEELQSDWHQKGRKEGYSKKIPRAPFEKTEAWNTLAVKRLITLAIGEGYDSIAIAPASEQTRKWGTDSFSWKKKNDNVWVVGTKSQKGGVAAGLDLEGMARERGLLLEQNGVEVSTYEDVEKIVDSNLASERTDKEVKKLATKIWAEMQVKDEGTKQPRREGYEFTYNELLPRLFRDVASKIDKAVTLEIAEIDTSDKDTSVAPIYYTHRRSPSITENPLLRERVIAKVDDDIAYYRKKMEEFAAEKDSPHKTSRLRAHGRELAGLERLQLYIKKPLTNLLDLADAAATFVKSNIYKLDGGDPYLDKIKTNFELAKAAIGLAQYHDALRAYHEIATDFFGIPQGVRARYEIMMKALPLTPKMKETIPEQGFTLFQGKEVSRGKIQFRPDAINIELLKNADLSTFLHETGHFFLEALADLATGKDSPKQAREDYQALLKWFGVTDRSQVERKHHEQFAEAFEKYLSEGKAPSERLRRAFLSFREWIISAYKKIANIPGTELTDEVRSVMDRMLATDEEIANAKKRQTMSPLFEDIRGLGIPEKDAVAYEKSFQEHEDTAREEVTQELIKDIERTRSALYKARENEVKEEVLAEINDDKNYIALSVLSSGNLPDGTPFPQNLKLSKDIIVSLYGKDRLPQTRPYIYAAKGGVHPDLAAEILGFNSGDEMLKVLASLPPKKDAIATRVKERMAEVMPPKYEISDIRGLVEETVNSKKRGEILQRELELLVTTDFSKFKNITKRISRKLPRRTDIIQDAQSSIASKKIRDIRPTVYLNGMKKASKEAIDSFLKGDVAQAYQSKLEELFFYEAYNESIKAKKAVESGVNYMGKFTTDTTRRKIGKAGHTYLEQIDAILDKFQFKRSVSLKTLDKRQSFLEWYKSLGPEKEYIEVNEKLFNDAIKTHYKDMTLTEFNGVVNSVKSIEHFVKVKNQLLANKRSRDFLDVKVELISSIAANHEIIIKKTNHGKTITDKFIEKKDAFVGAHYRPEFIAEWLDGYQELGPAWRHLFEPIADAQNNESKMMEGITVKLKEIFSVYSKKERTEWLLKMIDVPSLETTFTKPALMSLGLNWGNEYNRQAVLDGEGWTSQQVEEALKLLDKRDWEVIQQVWDYVDTFWPAMESLEKRMNGIAPEKVEAMPFENEHGKWKGGYYPLKYDPRRSVQQYKLETKQDVQDIFGQNFVRASTKKGHLENRTNSGGKAVLLNLSVLSDHLINVAHDLNFREPVLDVYRLVNDKDIRDAIIGALGRDLYNQLNPYLARVATDRKTEFINPLDQLFGALRSNATIVFMGWKFTTALVQFTGYFVSIKELGAKYAMRGLRQFYLNKNGIPDYSNMKKEFKFAIERSQELKNRMNTMDRDARDSLNRMDLLGQDRGAYAFLSSYTTPMRLTFFQLTAYMDMAVTVPTWLGAYEKSMNGEIKNAEKGSEVDAIAYADRTLRMTQGAGSAKDLAGIQTGSELHKLFTMFYSYFSVIFNQFAKETNLLIREGDKARAIANFALIWFIPAVLEDLVLGRGPDDDDDILAWMIKKEVQYPFASVVFFRDVANAAFSQYGYRLSPVASSVESIVRTAKTIGNVVTGEEVDRNDVKNIVNTTGYFVGLPSRQVWITSEYFYDWLTGGVTPKTPYEFLWRGLVTGKKND